jgi:hypothetical protein
LELHKINLSQTLYHLYAPWLMCALYNTINCNCPSSTGFVHFKLISFHNTCLGLARTVCIPRIIPRIWPNIWWFPSQDYRLYIVCIYKYIYIYIYVVIANPTLFAWDVVVAYLYTDMLMYHFFWTPLFVRSL